MQIIDIITHTIASYFLFLEFNDSWDYLVLAYFSVFIVQMYFYLGVFSKFAFFKQPQVRASKKLNPVSVIICAKNEGDNLKEFLPLILKQDYPEFEVIVVNDRSIDNTKEMLDDFAAKFPLLKVVNVPDIDQFYGSKKFALTLGIKAAKYDNVLLTDADCKPASNEWIKRMTGYSSKKKIILGFGAYEKRKGLLNKLIQFETFYTALQYFSFALKKSPYMGVGRNLAYKTDLFFKNDGFSSHQHILSGDDDLFINEVATASNTQIVVDEKAHTISLPKTTFKDWVAQKKRHFLAGKKYKLKHKLKLAILQLSQVLFFCFFISLVIKVKPIHLIIGVFVIRYLTQLVIFAKSMNKIGGMSLLLLFPFFELFFMFFNPLLVISNILVKKSKWN